MPGAALVTGAAKRLGGAIALALAERGYDIALHYHSSESEAEATAEHIRTLGRRCALFCVDLCNSGAAVEMLCAAHDKLGGLSLLVNNASMFKDNDLMHTDEELFDSNFSLHLKTPFFLVQKFANICQRGQVINIIDSAISKNATTYFAYHLSKKSMYDFTLMAAHALAPAIRVNAIAPGSTVEPIDEDGTYMERRARQVPLKMQGSPMYVIGGIDYLLQNEFVTGQCLFIDGGAHLQR